MNGGTCTCRAKFSFSAATRALQEAHSRYLFLSYEHSSSLHFILDFMGFVDGAELSQEEQWYSFFFPC